ncbi:MAG: VOC family protein [Chloroflexota bacterium]
MKIKGIIWVGTQTTNFSSMKNFFQNVLGLPLISNDPNIGTFEMPNGDKFEVFNVQSDSDMFMSHPVAGFLVDDIVSARAEMEQMGVEFLGPIQGETDDYKWSEFRAPDGFVYELTYYPGHPLNRK